MEPNSCCRHELKYPISYGDGAVLKNRIRYVMRSDPNADTKGKYLIRSIYFDNSDDKAFFEKQDGVNRREKFRIRYYNDDLSFISLEKKIKIDSLCLKCSAILTEEQCRQILGGDVSWMRNSGDGLIKELYVKMRYQGLRPKVTVSYIREPYIYKAGNVRVTLDSQIRTSIFHRDFLLEKFSDINAGDSPGEMILEVKYDRFLPEIIQMLIQIPSVRQQAFSKYAAARRYG